MNLWKVLWEGGEMSLKVLQGSRGGGEKAMDLVDPWASRSYWIDDRCQAGCAPRVAKSW